MKTFKEALRTKDFVLTAELPLSADMSGESVVARAASLSAMVDGVIVTDNRYGQTHMSPLAAASLMLQANIDPILQLGCRNRNRIAILSELLGARAIGVSSLYLVQGEKFPAALVPQPKSVMDMQLKELVATATTINEDEKIERAESFLIGTSAMAHAPQEGWQPEELQAKCDAGARLLFTQLCFDKELLRAYLGMLIDEGMVRRASVIVSVGILPSADYARWALEKRRRALIPDSVIKRLEQADDDGQEGIAICAELIREYAEIPGVSGVSIRSSTDPDTMAAAIEASGRRA